MHDWGPAEAPAISRSSERPDSESEAAPSRTRRRRALADIIATEILPRLTARHAAAGLATPATAPATPDALARLVVAGRFDEARALLAARIAAGASTHALLREDIAQAARRLGELWAADDCDFVEVTFAARGLALLMREMAPCPESEPRRAAPSILVSPAPGETHTLAPEMVAGLFRLGGWQALCCEAEAARAAVAEQWFDVAAFSLSCPRYAPRLGLTVRSARVVSANPNIAILVGGPVFATNPGLARSLGANFCAPKGDLDAQFPRTIRKELRL